MCTVPAVLKAAISIACVVAVVCVPITTLIAAPCHHCGCDAACGKVCHPVCKTKKVKVTCWDCKCEPFCIPGPDRPCDDCGCGDRAACAKVQVRKKLMKKEVEKEIQVIEWVVEDLCPACRAECKPR